MEDQDYSTREQEARGREEQAPREREQDGPAATAIDDMTRQCNVSTSCGHKTGDTEDLVLS